MAVPAPCGTDEKIQGIVNTYYPGAESVSAGATQVTIINSPVGATSQLIKPGDRVLIMQMQDGIINSSNSIKYGDGATGGGCIDYGNAGLYEFAVVKSFAGSIITLDAPLQRSYSFINSGNRRSTFQVIRVPVYKKVQLIGAVTAPAWNGITGGIVAFHAWQQLDFNGNKIDVSSLGFRPGKKNSDGMSANVRDLLDYVSGNYVNFAEKGEGIAGTPNLSYPASVGYPNGSGARGAPGNAGGGGNAHNSGGGGGANIGDGGKGGYQYEGYGANDIGGLGGRGCPFISPAELWLGGGGGGGQQNNNGATGGAGGGGIVIITANAIIGTGAINANVIDAGTSADDGAGGGGAGGGIVVQCVNTIPNTILFSANGGKGGNQYLSPRSNHGPGGGAGGGLIALSNAVPASQTSVTGGGRGLATGSEYGAVDGSGGMTIVQGMQSLYPSKSVAVELIITDPAQVCYGESVDIVQAVVTAGSDNGPQYKLSYWLDANAALPLSSPSEIVQSGTYYIQLTNTYTGCDITGPVKVVIASMLKVDEDTYNNVSCNGLSDGSLQVAGSGGTAPYNYSIDNINWQSSTSFNNLSAGEYSVYVKDAKSCTSGTTLMITQPEILKVGEDTHVNVSCNGLSDGSLQVTGSGGTAAYNYSIDNVNWQSSTSFHNLSAGAYVVYIKDAKSCTSGTTLTITQPEVLKVAEDTHVNVSCNGLSDGSLQVIGSGGTAAYNYSIDNVNWQSSTSFHNLSVGEYSVYMKDAKSCTSGTTLTITQPEILKVGEDTHVNVSCNGLSDGSLQVAGSGGTAAYNYSIDNVNWQSSTSFHNLSAGEYSVYVKDAKSCTSGTTLMITQPEILKVGEDTHVNVSCNGLSDGSLQVTGSGGTAAYNYSIDNVNWQSSTSFHNLSAGEYSVYIKDTKSCISGTTLTITQPEVLKVAEDTHVNVSCNGLSDGSLQVAGSGGTAAYNYSIDNVNWQSSTSFNNLSAGKYSVYIKDAQICASVVNNIIIIQPDSLFVSASVADVLCNNKNTGEITSVAWGGVTSYIYSLWKNEIEISHNENGFFTSLPADSYMLSVTDANKCVSAPLHVTVNQPSALNVKITSYKNVSCYGGTNGIFSVKASGGISPYSFNLEEMGQYIISSNIASFGVLKAGDYTLLVKDGNSCDQTMKINLEQPDSLIAAMQVTNLTCGGNIPGGVDISATGGVASYRYSIQGIDTSNNTGHFLLNVGRYQGYVTDKNGCRTTPQTFEISILEDCDLLFPSGFTPNGDGLNDLFRPVRWGYINNYELHVYNRWGEIVYETRRLGAGWNGIYGGKLQPSGTYVWYAIYRDKNGRQRVLKGTVVLIR
ncbi:MAG: gliding motility-associated C-terminal domain-containing protein [Filimonas sp.]|nr:gliding motility-associated C-terminal domain-containing protein [Filimonas sp.]